MADLKKSLLEEPSRGILTGCSSGIGLAMGQHLLTQNPNLHLLGLSRTPGPLASHDRFTHWPSDLSDLQVVRKRAARYLQEFEQCDLLIHAAGQGLFSPSNDWSVEELQKLVNLDLTAPMLLSGLLTDRLRKSQGFVVFVGSTSSRERAPLGSAYAACKAGLHRFSENYFQENRKHGVRVLHLCPAWWETNFYKGERFQPAPGSENSVDLDSLTELVHFFFRGTGRHINPTHLVIEPSKTRILKK